MIGVNPFWLATRSGAAAPVMPLRFVSPTNFIGTASSANEAGRLGRICRTVHYIGSGDVSELVLRVSGWVNGGSATASVGNAFSLNAVYVKVAGGACVQAKFSGSTSVDVPDGTLEILSDPLYPSDFGLSTFTRGTKIFVTPDGRIASNGLKFPRHPWLGGYTGSDSYRYDPGAYTFTNLTGEGALTYTGTGGGGIANGFNEQIPIQMLGRFVGSDKAVFMGIGDSITNGTGSTTTSGNAGGSFFSRSLWPTDLVIANPYAGMNTGLSGGNAGVWADTTQNSVVRLGSLLKYANRYIDEYGINDVAYAGGSVLADTIYAKSKVIFDAIKAQPAVTNGLPIKIARTSVLNKTSTDGLTPLAGCTLGETLDYLNQKFPTRAGIDFDDYINLRNIGMFLSDVSTDAANFQWSTTYATDGLHPNETGHTRIAANGVRAWVVANAP